MDWKFAINLLTSPQDKWYVIKAFYRKSLCKIPYVPCPTIDMFSLVGLVYLLLVDKQTDIQLTLEAFVDSTERGWTTTCYTMAEEKKIPVSRVKICVFIQAGQTNKK